MRKVLRFGPRGLWSAYESVEAMRGDARTGAHVSPLLRYRSEKVKGMGSEAKLEAESEEEGE
jgi:hypothetical protein